MIRPNSKRVRTTAVLYIFMIQLLLYSPAIGDSSSPTSAVPSGAEFLKNVIGNMPKPNRPNHPNHHHHHNHQNLQNHPNRKAVNDRIDVEEYIPNDVPYPSQDDVIQMLSKQPLSFSGPNSQINYPNFGDVHGNQADLAFSQLSDSQNRIVSQGAHVQPPQFTALPNNAIPQNIIDALTDGSKKPDATISGYNFFFYPLDNNGLQQLQNSNNLQQFLQNSQMTPAPTADLESTNSDHHMTKPKVEPLFVAMAGFVGVAVVFLSALMFIPRLPIPLISSKAAVLKRAPEELASLTKLVAESIDGKDCSERIACEVGRAMRSMNVGNKPIRMMEIILPPSVAKQLAQIRRSASRKEQCHFIMCKKTEGTLKLVAKLKKSHNLLDNNNKTIHDVRDIFKV